MLVHLSEAPGGRCGCRSWPSRLLLSRSGLTRRIDGLVRAGLVARRPCHDDGRGALAELTPPGWRRLQQAAPIHVAGVRRYLIGPLVGERRRGGAGRPGAGPGPGRAGARRELTGYRGRRPVSPAGRPVTTAPPRSIQPLVPPATDTAR